MLILLIMAAGVLIGMRWFPPSLQKYNSMLQAVCTSLLIFSMGVSLGSRPEFFDELQSIGLYSRCLQAFPSFCLRSSFFS